MTVRFLLLWLTFMTASSVVAIVLGRGMSEQEVVRRVRAAADPSSAAAPDPEDEVLRRPLAERVVFPAVRRLGVLILGATSEVRQSRMRESLRNAGYETDVGAWLARKTLLAAILGGGVALLTRSHAFWPLAAAASAALGWRWPDMSLERVAKQRRRAIARALPDVLDLLCVSVEAGLGFDGAMQKVAEKFPGPVAAEFGGYLRDVRLGQARDVALRAMATRCGVPELQTTVAVVIQAERLGASLARVLRVQSDELRVRRRQAAQERAMQIPVKLIFPLVLFIFPAIFVVLLGPAALHVMKALTTR